MWRITDDFWDDWKLLKGMFQRCELWQNHVSEGCYPDCDMLPLGYLEKGFGQERMTYFTYEEQRTMMTLWCLFGSPLMLGAEMTKMDSQTLALLTNKEILEMLTPKCRPMQINFIKDKGNEQAVWAAYNQENGSAYVALFNLNDETSYVSAKIQELKVALLSLGMQEELRGHVQGYELWTGENEEIIDGHLKKKLPPHGCVIYRLF